MGVVCVGEDITGRKEMEAAKLKSMVLEKSNHAKDAFLASMSHEMRTPLNGLLGMLQLAAASEEPLPEKVMRYIKQAKNSGTLLLHLINDILDITRIEAGHLQLEVRAFSQWLRFPADLVIRLTDEGESTFVDLRSASHFAQHDLGDNADRISSFLADLDGRMEPGTED